MHDKSIADDGKAFISSSPTLKWKYAAANIIIAIPLAEKRVSFL